MKVWTKKGEQKLPDFRPPQLATLVTEIPEGDGWLFEMKFDGYRAIAAIAGRPGSPLHAQRQRLDECSLRRSSNRSAS